MKQYERIQNREDNIEKDFDIGRFFELATTNKIYVNGLNLHEIKSEILRNYTGDFELNGSTVIGPVEHETNFGFRNMDDFESYIKVIDIEYYSEDVTFTGYVYNLNTHQFNVVKQSAHAESTNYMKEIVELGQNCSIPTSGMFYQMLLLFH